MRKEVARVFDEYDVIVSASATGPAPEGFASTGDPAANAPWTALGVPAISLPTWPVGTQVTARWGEDDALLAIAATM